jgi:hypothetical protein
VGTIEGLYFCFDFYFQIRERSDVFARG